jgi:hypothetical protein
MEYCDGGSLASVVARGNAKGAKMRETHIAYVLRCALKALVS